MAWRRWQPTAAGAGRRLSTAIWHARPVLPGAASRSALIYCDVVLHLPAYAMGCTIVVPGARAFQFAACRQQAPRHTGCIRLERHLLNLGAALVARLTIQRTPTIMPGRDIPWLLARLSGSRQLNKDAVVVCTCHFKFTCFTACQCNAGNPFALPMPARPGRHKQLQTSGKQLRHEQLTFSSHLPQALSFEQKGWSS